MAAARPAPENPLWASERRAILGELRRRIEGLERRPVVPAAGPRLPPAPLTAGTVDRPGPRLADLADLDGAEDAPFGARFRARVPAARVGLAPGDHPAEAPRWLGRLAGLAEPLPAGLAGLRIVDCETTGLAGGTGTIPFLVGVAWFEGDGTLVTEQLLLRGPGAEGLLLDDLLALLGGGQALVTFNGRSFDAPLLRTRCVLARRPAGPLVGFPHLDLLPVARRMWRGRGDDCRLVTLEERVLRRTRVDDVSGALAPLAYSAFLRGGDAAPLGPIVTHNREDLVGTAALLVTALRILAAPEQHAEDAWELRAAALLRLRHDGAGAAVPLLARALELASSPALRRRLFGELALVERRDGHFEAAGSAWAAYQREFPGENRGFVEAARLLERRARDPAGALAVLARAPHPAAVDVEHRRERLERRLARSLAVPGGPGFPRKTRRVRRTASAALALPGAPAPPAT